MEETLRDVKSLLIDLCEIAIVSRVFVNSTVMLFEGQGFEDNMRMITRWSVLCG